LARRRVLYASAALLLRAGTAVAQQAEPAAKPPAADDDDAKGAELTSVPAPEAREAPPIPPPAPPRAGEQRPAPFFYGPERSGRVRNVDVGLLAGISHRPSDQSTASYSAGFAYGVHARIEAARWLGVRAYVLKSDHSVTIPQGALGLPGTDVQQPDLDVTLLALRAEPTWVVTPRIRLWAGIGIGWSFVSADPLTTSGPFTVRTAERHGVGLEPSAGLGGSFDAVPGWLSVSLVTSAGLLTEQSGDMFERVQGIDANGSIVYAAGLPKFESAYSVLLAVGALL
jgi:hypothetical protein